MQVVESISHLRVLLDEPRRSGRTIGLVPTMGALHAGHQRLIERAREDCEFVAVSIFVNPLQFERKDDLDRYPRDLEADLDVCRRAGVDVVFTPSVTELYPTPPVCVVDVRQLADHLCGRFRPGHFSGVATVVLKLFQIVLPDRSYFGDKDAQQLAVVRRLARDFNIPVTIIGVPTVRDPDGLALSSRNRRLTPSERARATALYKALCEARSHIAGGITDAEEVKRRARAAISPDETVRLEYLEVVDADMQPVTVISAPVIVAGAMWVGETRLIDNLPCIPPSADLEA